MASIYGQILTRGPLATVGSICELRDLGVKIRSLARQGRGEGASPRCRSSGEVSAGGQLRDEVLAAALDASGTAWSGGHPFLERGALQADSGADPTPETVSAALVEGLGTGRPRW